MICGKRNGSLRDKFERERESKIEREINESDFKKVYLGDMRERAGEKRRGEREGKKDKR